MYKSILILVTGLALGLVAVTPSVRAQASCCEGNRGNISLLGDCDPGDDVVDIGDLSRLIDVLFISYGELCCLEEADIAPSQAPDGQVDVGDLTGLIDYLFISHHPLPPCDGSVAQGYLIDYSSCKTWSSATAPEDHTSDQDCLVWEYDGVSILHLRHINAGFNCCPVMTQVIRIVGATIEIDETSVEGDCYCLCLFDIEYEITNLPPGQYEIVVLEPLLPSGDDPLAVNVDLTSQPQGDICVSRSQYPWGE